MTAPAEATAPPAQAAGGPNDEQTQATIQAAIGEISHIATLPEVTLKIIKLVEDPNSTAQDLNKVITNDPALGARILKVVNSAFYGLPGQIGSINRAIVLLGLNAVKNIAIAASLAKLFRGGKVCSVFDAKDLWTHSIATATATKLLAQKANLGLPDEAFLAGLIHDIGLMVELQARRADFVEAVETAHAQGRPLRKVEAEVLGATHEQFGQALCKLWKFPVTFQNVAGYHHRPLELPEDSRALACLVHLADVLTKQLDAGYTGDVETDQIDPAIKEALKLTQQDFDEVMELLPQALEEASAVFTNPAAAA
ncbi:MAG: HDOD domain-containing protein [Planctomycetota bacterium]